MFNIDFKIPIARFRCNFDEICGDFLLVVGADNVHSRAASDVSFFCVCLRICYLR